MSILSGIVSFVTGIVETVVTTIAAAIAAPTIGSVTAAIATVAVVAGAGYLIYKGVNKLFDLAEKRVDNLRNAENVPTRYKLDKKDDDDEDYVIDMSGHKMCDTNYVESSDNAARAIYKLDNGKESYRRSRERDDDIFDEIRRERTRRYCEDAIVRDRFDDRFRPHMDVFDEYEYPITVIDNRGKKKNKKKKKKVKKFVDAEYIDIVNDMYNPERGGMNKRVVDNVLALHGLGPNPSTFCLS